MHEQFMRAAIRLSELGMDRNRGGPFGAVVVLNGEVIGRGWNKVTSSNDPTAHAEIVAIRAACRKLKTFHLRTCDLYTSCEPCPMCLSAIYWARIRKVYFANTRIEAAAIGFDDNFIYTEVALPLKRRRLKMQRLLPAEAQAIFERWRRKPDKRIY